MSKIKCIKAECPICKATGSIQLFFNKDGILRYARTRHFSQTDKDSKKPQFTYCKLTDLEALKTLLSDKGISLSTDRSTAGQVGQANGFATIDPQLRGCASVQQNKPWASSSVRTEHQPPKLGVEGSNPSPPAISCSSDPFFLILCLPRRTRIIAKPAKAKGTSTIARRGTGKYSVAHFHVMLDGWLIINSVELVAPDAATLPVPTQTEHTNCVTREPFWGESTEA